jgi:hypothetical protein
MTGSEKKRMCKTLTHLSLSYREKKSGDVKREGRRENNTMCNPRPTCEF